MSMPPLNEAFERFSAPRRGGGIIQILCFDLVEEGGPLGRFERSHALLVQTESKMSKAHQKQKAEFSTLQSRLKIELLTDNRSQSHTVTLRMERGKTIWLNAFLNMLRVKITPKKVEMYNKIDRTYFEGDYSLINVFLGLKLNFENLERKDFFL